MLRTPGRGRLGGLPAPKAPARSDRAGHLRRARRRRAGSLLRRQRSAAGAHQCLLQRGHWRALRPACRSPRSGEAVHARRAGGPGWGGTRSPARRTPRALGSPPTRTLRLRGLPLLRPRRRAPIPALHRSLARWTASAAGRSARCARCSAFAAASLLPAQLVAGAAAALPTCLRADRPSPFTLPPSADLPPRQLCVWAERRGQQLGQGPLHRGRGAHRLGARRRAQGGRGLRLPAGCARACRPPSSHPPSLRCRQPAASALPAGRQCLTSRPSVPCQPAARGQHPPRGAASCRASRLPRPPHPCHPQASSSRTPWEAAPAPAWARC